jgi:hypothetical protein
MLINSTGTGLLYSSDPEDLIQWEP